MSELSFDVFPHWNFGGFEGSSFLRRSRLKTGLLIEYRQLTQFVDPKTINSSNLRGSGWGVGLGTEWTFERFSLLLSLDFWNTHHCPIPEENNPAELTYGGIVFGNVFEGLVGFHVQGGYEIAEGFALVASYSRASFSKAGTEQGATSFFPENPLVFHFFTVGSRFSL